MGLVSAAGALGGAGAGVRGAALSLRVLPGVARVAAGVLGGGADGPRVGDRDGARDGRGGARASAGRGAAGGARDDGAGVAAAAVRAGRRAAGAVRAVALELGAQPSRAPPPAGVLAWLLDAIAAAHRVARQDDAPLAVELRGDGPRLMVRR